MPVLKGKPREAAVIKTLSLVFQIIQPDIQVDPQEDGGSRDNEEATKSIAKSISSALHGGRHLNTLSQAGGAFRSIQNQKSIEAADDLVALGYLYIVYTAQLDSFRVSRQSFGARSAFWG